MSVLNRRQFLHASTLAAPALAGALNASAAAPAKGAFHFPLLGDLHFDRLDHHDMGWLGREKPNDVRQVENYSRLTAEMLPRLFARIRETVAALRGPSPGRVPFVLHVGDFVEGLCGTDALAHRQNSEAVAFVEQSKLGAPFLFTKGNHDVTGPGATDAYRGVFHPFLGRQLGKAGGGPSSLSHGFYALEHGDAQFAFFDAYDSKASLEWYEALSARRTAKHQFVIVHPPVVPYGARVTWHLFSNAKQKAQRDHLLGLLGKNGAYVLTGHIHRYNCAVRETPKGRFLQLAVSSIISTPEPEPKDVLNGVGDYTPDQIRVEPGFGKGTEEARHEVVRAERPFVKAFQYADLPGYAVLRVDGNTISATLYPGVGNRAWRTLNLTEMLHA